MRLDAPLVDAVGQGAQPAGHTADQRDERRLVLRSHVDEPLDPARRSRAAVFGSTPHSASTGSFWRKSSIRSGAITGSPSGFLQPEASAATNVCGAEAGGAS